MFFRSMAEWRNFNDGFWRKVDNWGWLLPRILRTEKESSNFHDNIVNNVL